MGGRSRELPAILVCGKSSSVYSLFPFHQLQWLVVRGHCSLSSTTPGPVGQEGVCSDCGVSSVSSDALDAATTDGRVVGVETPVQLCAQEPFFLPPLLFT